MAVKLELFGQFFELLIVLDALEPLVSLFSLVHPLIDKGDQPLGSVGYLLVLAVLEKLAQESEVSLLGLDVGKGVQSRNDAETRLNLQMGRRSAAKILTR